MFIDDHFIMLEFDQASAVLSDEEPSRFLYETTGRIVGIGEEDDSVLIGKFAVFYVNVAAAVNEETSLYDVMDTTAAAFDYFAAIFDPQTEDIATGLDELLNFEFGYGNILILDRLEILPAFRGHRLGLAIMKQLIERFGVGAELVAIKPFPLQGEGRPLEPGAWRDSLELEKLGGDFETSSAKLRQYYSELGFKRLEPTPYMFLMI